MSFLIVTVSINFLQWTCVVCPLTFPWTHTKVLFLPAEVKKQLFDRKDEVRQYQFVSFL